MKLNKNDTLTLKEIRKKIEEIKELSTTLSIESKDLDILVNEGLKATIEITGTEEIFIKNTLDVDVDGLKGINRYIVKAMYNVEQENGSYKLEHRLLEDLEMTWNEIEEEGGIAEVNKQLRECYNI